MIKYRKKHYPFFFHRASVLVVSSCASMGFDVKDVRAVVNVGKPSSDWILSQQMGRAGRDGHQSVCINLSRAVRVTGRGKI